MCLSCSSFLCQMIESRRLASKSQRFLEAGGFVGLTRRPAVHSPSIMMAMTLFSNGGTQMASRVAKPVLPCSGPLLGKLDQKPLPETVVHASRPIQHHSSSGSVHPANGTAAFQFQDIGDFEKLSRNVFDPIPAVCIPIIRSLA
jgi:hypothetical protein